jgi:hypothetical protein
MNRDCSIITVDEVGTSLDVTVCCPTCSQSEIPEQWRAGTLSRLERTEDHVSQHGSASIPRVDATQRVDLPGCYYRDSDFCFLDDMTGAFVLLSHEPPVSFVIERANTSTSH